MMGKDKKTESYTVIGSALLTMHKLGSYHIHEGASTKNFCHT